jgi:GAF domain-containing protein
VQSAEGSYARELREGAAALGNGLRRPPNPKDAEIGRLRRELRESRDREERAAAEAAAARERLSQLSAASRRFASSMRVRAVERDRFKRRLAAQYSVGRTLAGAGSLDEVSPKIFAILAEELGWHLGVFWKMDEGRKVLSYGGAWRAGGETPRGFEEAPRHATFACGVGLPGRVWSRGGPAWIEGMPGDSSIRGDVAAAEDLRTALAFPIRERDRVVGVFELFSRDGASPDEDLARTAALVGDQIGQLLGRRHAEEERDRLLNRRWIARIELEERERISRELHDRVAHSMGVAHQSLQLYEAFQKTQPSKAAEKLALAKEMTKTALESTRNLSMELRQSETEWGIVPALEALVEVAVPPGMSAELRTDGDESMVPPHSQPDFLHTAGGGAQRSPALGGGSPPRRVRRHAGGGHRQRRGRRSGPRRDDRVRHRR